MAEQRVRQSLDADTEQAGEHGAGRARFDGFSSTQGGTPSSAAYPTLLLAA